ncbi:MAG TPA: hypothetical protein VE710_12155 [Candidatus Bathyarchaeia archaeon]|nr:hypothetical protein [Candidatus Bathyarchaeia archaeon]
MRDFLVYCTYCSSYTLLHSYDKETSTFLGEYSLLHNEYTRNSVVLNKFLLTHLGHTLRTIPSKTDEYMNIICSANHFLEDDIDKYVEESMEQIKYREWNMRSEREIGKVQLHIVEHLLEHELNSLTDTRASTPAEGQVLIGKELGIKRAIEILREVRSNKQYA